MSRNTIAVWTNNPTRKEAVATAVAISPGALLEYSGANVQAVSTADVYPTPLIVAEENELEGEGVDTAYAASARVFFRHPYPGDYFQLLLADGENVSEGDLLTPSNDGTVVKVSASEVPVAVAKEDLDLSASANTDAALLLCEML